MAKTIRIIALESFPLINQGDDLANTIVEAAEKEHLSIDDGDILVVAQKIVSIAEGRVVMLRDVKPSQEAEKLAKVVSRDPRLVELVLRESSLVVKASKDALVVKDRRGLVCINAGIDKSNVPGEDSYTLLPEDPDRSAEKIRLDIKRLTGRKVAVLICDTYSRPFRKGQVEFAVGIAGINPFKDYRGKKDLFNYVLKVKNVAIVDEIASAAELVMGQGNEARPIVFVKDLNRIEQSDISSIGDLSVSKQIDLYRGAL